MIRPLWVAKLLVKLGMQAKVHPHEKAAMGIGTWGRQAEAPGAVSAKTVGKVGLKLRVYRAATGKWEDIEE